MKTILTLSFTVIVGVILSDTVFTNSNVPPPSRTGAPGESTCANSGCHGNNNPLNGNGILGFTFSGGNTYAPGQTYTLSLSVSNGSEYGMEMVALDASEDASVGRFIATTGRNFVRNGFGVHSDREYISHQVSDSDSAWTYEWTAPDSAVGSITFYCAGNAANNDNSTSGDRIYVHSWTIDPLPAGVSDSDERNGRMGSFEVYPNPANDLVYFHSLPFSDISEWELYNYHGTLAAKGRFEESGSNIPGSDAGMLNLSEQQSGLYRLLISNSEGGRASAWLYKR